MKARFCAVGIIHNDKGEILIAKMPPNRGAYRGKWGILGGGMEDGETVEDTLHREAGEEFGIEVKNAIPFTFHDDTPEKIHADGHKEKIYMVYCIYDCDWAGGEVKTNDEWEEWKWVKPEDLKNYDLNEPTIRTFKLKGWL